MADDRDALLLQLSADIRGMERQLARARNEARDSANSIQTRFDRMNRDVGRSFDDMARGGVGALGRLSAGASLALGAIIALSIRAAATAGETRNAFEVAMGAQTAAAERFAQTYSNQVGRSLTSTREKMAQVQLVLTGIGQTAETALHNTEIITRRAVDLGSLWNVDDAEAFRAILSGINGETEPMRRFGVSLNQAALNAELLRMGITRGATAATEAQKAQARLNLILRATASAENDAIRTSGSLTNQTRAMQAQFQNAAETFGERFLPVANRVVGWANDALGAFNNLPSGLQNAGLAMLALVAASGPIAQLIAGLRAVTIAAITARNAVTGAGIAGAAAGAVPIAAGVAVGATEIRLGGDILSSARQDSRLRRVLANPGAASDADLAGSLAWIRNEAAHDVSSQSRAVDAQIQLQPVIDARANQARMMTFLQGQNALFSSTLAAAQAAAPPPNTRTGTGRGGRTVRGDGLIHPEALEALPWTSFTVPDEVIDVRRIEQDVSLATADGVTQGFIDGQREAQDEMRDGLRQTIGGALEAAIHGGWPGLAEYMGKLLGERLLDRAADGLTDLVMSIGRSGVGGNPAAGGGGNWMASAAQFALSLFSGHAAGTDSSPGGWHKVGEFGTELVNMAPGARVLPNHALGGLSLAGASGLGPVSQNFHIDATNSILAADFFDRIDEMGARATVNGGLAGMHAARSVVPRDMAKRALRKLGTF